MEIEKSIIDVLVEEIASDPNFSEIALAQSFCFPITDFRNITKTEFFRERVAARRLEIQKEIAEARLSGKAGPDVMKLAEKAASKRLLKEVDNDIDGTPATRVAASKAVIEATRKQDNLGAVIVVEMSPDKFEKIFSVRRESGELAGVSIHG